ncbi:MAG: carboxypeptidase regulatory-like domain-containing protein [Bacteroidetes bacterium QH_10_64_37]|nr:MAG: carboxypeptidase regulatory-like domain-containing protein [Bacteroidetes bacterium QH_10_64_37]
MPNHYVPFVYRSSCVLLFFSLVLLVAGCDEETLGPQTRGTLTGVVQDAETNDPIAQANVTTSPPTQSVLTGADGTFEIEDVSTGNYSVEATKSGYESGAVQVSVQEHQTTNVTLLLERGEDFGSENDSLAAQVTNWFNDRVNRDSTGADSIFADVEYSARNVGDVRIQAYEVYFEIDTSEGTFSKEISGDSLDTEQRDVGGFRKYIPAEAQAVRVEDVYWEASSD